MSIVCTGSIAYDYIMSFPGYFRDHILPESLHTISLSFLVDTMVRQRGGTAPNIAYTLALLKERPLLAATAGKDFDEYRQWLEANNIDTTYVKVIPDVYTASFFANTDLANAQIASFYTGAMAHACEISLREISPTPELIVISPNDPKAMDLYVYECLDMGIPYVYDPSQQIVRVDAKEIRAGVEGAHSLFVNEYEYELLQKHTGLSEKDILNCVDYMVVTLGEKGAVVYTGDERYSIPAATARQTLTPTGVGDAFRGGFLRGYRLGLDWQTCGQMGALAATYCLEMGGTQCHTFTPQEFVGRYRQVFGDQGLLDVLLK